MQCKEAWLLFLAKPFLWEGREVEGAQANFHFNFVPRVFSFFIMGAENEKTLGARLTFIFTEYCIFA